MFRHTRRDDQVNSIFGSQFPIRERETKLPCQICVDLDSGMRRLMFHKVKHLYVKVFLCAGVCAFDPFLGVGWREILSWYPVECARLMDMVIV